MNYARMKEIETIVASKVARIRETKGKEYATDEDTLADFFEVAAEAGITPLQCWLTYVQKHQRAISTFVREGSTKSEAIEDRVTDVIVYHVLLIGLLEDLGIVKKEANPKITIDSVSGGTVGEARMAAYDGEGDLLL